MMDVPGIVSKIMLVHFIILRLNHLYMDCNIEFLETDLTRRD